MRYTQYLNNPAKKVPLNKSVVNPERKQVISASENFSQCFLSPRTENIRTYGEASSNQEMTDTAAINFRLGESPQVNGIDHPDGNEMVTSQPYEIDSTAKSNEIVDTSKLNGVGVTRKITPVANMFVSMKPSSPSPSTSSTSRSSLGKMNFEQSPSGSRASTPSTSYESRRSYSRHSRSRSTTPSSNLPSNHIVFNKDELKKCDHRLKLFFNMELFHEEEEQFNVLLKVMIFNHLNHHPW